MMRLTCPNCAAQYEVPEDVIPAEGRDVQCSNCSQTWFQPAAAAAEDAAEDAVAERAPADTGFEEPPARTAETEAEAEVALEDNAPEPEPEDSAAAEVLQEAEPAPQAEPATAAAAPEDSTGDETDEQPAAGAEDEDAAPEAAPQPQRARALDPAMTDILREEAARESSLRAAERENLETQPDLGLDIAAAEEEAALRSRQARDRMARIRGEDPHRPDAAEGGSRKELLPDIEEINSTLRSGGTAAPAAQAPADEVPVRRKSNFARGFSVSLAAALVLLLIYDNAPLIAEKLPSADPALSSYVGWVDQARLWLDGQVKTIISVQ